MERSNTRAAVMRNAFKGGPAWSKNQGPAVVVVAHLGFRRPFPAKLEARRRIRRAGNGFFGSDLR